MLKRQSQILCVWFLIWDLVVTALAWLGAYSLRVQSGLIPLWNDPPDFYLCLRQTPLVLILAAIAYRVTGQYEIHRLRRFREEILCVLKGTALLSLLVMSTSFYLHDPYDSRLTMMLFTVLAAVGVLVQRQLSWALIRRLRSRGYNQTYSIIVGTGRVA
ncbi:MAG: undecaprenyl-phosphate glucose phosphotransferase, partial [Gemmataceae bacterium]